tara:strand:+ start:1738 stop:2409 length:672 start_codon:yes stop_codon:yes gene_type:complete
MTEQIIDTTPATTTEEVATEETKTQEQRMFSQDELNDILSKRIAQVKSKYDDINPDEYRELKTLRQQQEEEQMIKRNEFDKLLKQTKVKADEEVNTLRGELEKIKVDGALISAASQKGSVNPEHIAQLLKASVRLDPNGSVTVVDSEGNPRYTESADPMSVTDLVEDFLSVNTYYRSAGPQGTGSQSNTDVKSSTQSVDLSQLDLTRPDHREIYRKMKQEGKL